MGSAGIGRLFVELGGSNKELNDSLKEAIAIAKEGGTQITRAGQTFITTFNDALNPTKQLTEQLQLLQAAGKSDAEIVAVLGDRFKAAGDAARSTGQPVSELFTKFEGLASAGKQSGVSVESLGNALKDFASNPLAAAQSGIGSLLEMLGPVGTAIGAFGAAAIAAGAAVGSMVVDLADQMEQLENLSAITGISTQDLEAYKQVAKEAGLESIDLGKMIGKLNQELGSGKSDEFTKAVEKLGISLTDLSTGKPKDAVTLLDDIREKLLAISDPAERAQAANQVLGGRLRELIPLLTNSSTSLKDAAEKMKALGITTDELSKNNLKNLDSALDKVGTAWDAFTKDVKLGISNLILMSPAIGAVVSHLNQQKQATVDYTRAAEKMVETWEVQWKLDNEKKLKDQAKALEEDAAQAIKTAQAVADLGEELQQLADKQEKAMASDFTKYLADAEKLFYANAKAAREWGDAVSDAVLKGLKAEADFNAQVGQSTEDWKAQIDTRKVKWDSWLSDMDKAHLAAVAKINAEAQGMAKGFVDDLAGGFADVLVKGADFASTMTNIFKNLAADILTHMLEHLFKPLEDKLGDLLSKGLGKLIGVGGDTGGGISIPGIGGGGGGGSAGGGIGSILGGGDLMGSVVTGAVSGLVSGVIGAIMNRDTSSKEIEVNTRYTHLKLDAVIKNLSEILDVDWKIQQAFRPLDYMDRKLEWIHGDLTQIQDIDWIIVDRLNQVVTAIQKSADAARTSNTVSDQAIASSIARTVRRGGLSVLTS